MVNHYTQKAKICSNACSHALLGLFASLHWFERMAKSHAMIRLRCKLQKKMLVSRTWESIPEDDFLVEPLQSLTYDTYDSAPVTF